MLNVNKNFGFTKVSGEWILLVDADERVSKDLADEISRVIKDGKKIDGYWIPRKNMLFGKWIEHTGWYPDHQLRLFRKGKGTFAEKHVHEMIRITGETEYLKEHIIHYNFDSIAHFLKKTVMIYAPNEANNIEEKGYQFHWSDAIRFPVKEFLSRYFTREGYRDGFHGLMLSLLMGFYHFIVFAYLWEKRSYNADIDPSMQDLRGEVKRAGKEFTYWVTNEELKQTSGILKKTLLKVSQKLS